MQYEIIGPRIIQAYKTLRGKKLSTDAYLILLLCYGWSPLQDFGSYLTILVSLDEKNIQLLSKQRNSYFINYEIPPGIYTIKGISEAVYTMGDHEGIIQNEYDDISMKTKFFWLVLD